MAPLGAIYVYLGAFLGASWPILGPSWAVLGLSWAILGQSWPILARLWLFWGSLGTLLGHLGAILDHLKAILKESWTILNPKPKFNDGFTFLMCFNLQWPYFKGFYSRFGVIWGPIFEIILGPDRPNRSQDGPKRTIKSLNVPKTCICKNLENPLVFQGSWGSKAVQDSL